MPLQHLQHIWYFGRMQYAPTFILHYSNLKIQDSPLLLFNKRGTVPRIFSRCFFGQTQGLPLHFCTILRLWVTEGGDHYSIYNIYYIYMLNGMWIKIASFFVGLMKNLFFINLFKDNIINFYKQCVDSPLRRGNTRELGDHCF